MARLFLFNKPDQVLSTFTDPQGRATLSDFISTPGIYAAGRLDYDSEGLLLLTDDGTLQHRLAHPDQKLPKTYWVLVEGAITDQALEQLRRGVELNDGMTRPAQAQRIDAVDLWTRERPIRERKEIPTQWIALTLTEGRNRQVRRMTAAVGFPTLRLVRVRMGPWSVSGISPGEIKESAINLPATEKVGGQARHNRSKNQSSNRATKRSAGRQNTKSDTNRAARPKRHR